MTRRSKRKALNSSSPMPLIILGIGVVLLVFAIILFAQNARTGNTTPDSIQRVSAAETMTEFLNGEVIILDVRSQTAFNDRRISGSVNIPLEELEQRLGELDKDKWIITYCT
ncbi:MAG: hypothetical protein MUO76_02255 [Anaerolineaceae bacterium]|nr:hypothetical protein [Anaerolineaceae bacterium]